MTSNNVTIAQGTRHKAQGTRHKAQGTRHKAQGTRPLLSVIIPVYNVEKYLNKCVQSVVNQTYTNLEIILVDDGSTDKSGTICDEWAKKDSRVRVIHKENGGQAMARNIGLNTMKGSLVAFVDSDDYLSTDMYEKLYNVMIENDADMSICTCFETNSEGNIIPPDRVRFKIDKSNYDYEVISRDKALTKLITPPYKIIYDVLWTKLHKVELFNGVRFPEGRKHDDTATSHRVIGACNKIAVLYKALYYYRIHNTSISGKSRGKYFELYDFHSREFIAIDRYNFLMSIGRYDLVNIIIKYSYNFMIGNLFKVNYIQYRRDISPFLRDIICKLIKTGKIKNCLRAVKLALICLRSIFRPFINEEQEK